MAALVTSKLLRQIAELRFCIVELHRRLPSDQGCAWLWKLKEHATRQVLDMLRSQVDDEFVELPSAKQRTLIANHWLRQDPRTATIPKWRRELQTRARQALEQSLQELQLRRDTPYGGPSNGTLLHPVYRSLCEPDASAFRLIYPQESPRCPTC